MEAVRTLIILAILCISIECAVENQSPRNAVRNSKDTVKQSKREGPIAAIPSTSNGVSVGHECPLGFTYVPSIGKCYKAIWEAIDWYSAAKRCEEVGHGSYVVAITSAEENREVKTFLAAEISRNVGNKACFINGVAATGHMFWTSGQQLVKANCQTPFAWKQSIDKVTAFDYTNWIPGEPNCSTDAEECVYIKIYYDFRWDDNVCSNKLCPLCEYTP